MIGKCFLPVGGLSFCCVHGLADLFSLMKSHLFIFSFVSLVRVDMVFEKVLLRLMSKSILPMVYSQSFMVQVLHSSL